MLLGYEALLIAKLKCFVPNLHESFWTITRTKQMLLLLWTLFVYPMTIQSKSTFLTNLNPCPFNYQYGLLQDNRVSLSTEIIATAVCYGTAESIVVEQYCDIASNMAALKQCSGGASVFSSVVWIIHSDAIPVYQWWIHYSMVKLKHCGSSGEW